MPSEPAGAEATDASTAVRDLPSVGPVRAEASIEPPGEMGHGPLRGPPFT